jgi:glycerophosphoryl diester phosphodiesterase
MLKYIYALVLITYFEGAYAQQKYTPANIHSHNDYSRPHAFYHAYSEGAGAIEADVFLRDGRLVVAHDSTTLKRAQTLKSMYIDPLPDALRQNPHILSLLIDIKGPYKPALAQLLKEVKPLIQFTGADSTRKILSIVITGNKPPPSEYAQYPDYIWFDDNLQSPHTPEQWNRVAQVSLNFQLYSKWRGDGLMPEQEEQLLKGVINAVHASGKKIRFWNAPDNAAGWKKLIDLGADILNTDNIEQLAAYLSNLPG